MRRPCSCSSSARALPRPSSAPANRAVWRPDRPLPICHIQRIGRWVIPRGLGWLWRAFGTFRGPEGVAMGTGGGGGGAPGFEKIVVAAV